jgi:phytoene dehydrogenase-like protein
VLCSLTEPYRLIQEQRRVEVFRDLLSTERLLAARSDNESWREYVRELRRTARDHSQEVQAFCEAHPELGQLLAEESAADT